MFCLSFSVRGITLTSTIPDIQDIYIIFWWFETFSNMHTHTRSSVFTQAVSDLVADEIYLTLQFIYHQRVDVDLVWRIVHSVYLLTSPET